MPLSQPKRRRGVAGTSTSLFTDSTTLQDALEEGLRLLERVEGSASEVARKAILAWNPKPAHVVNMSDEDGKEAAFDKLADIIFDPKGYDQHVLEVTLNNPYLREILASQTANTHTIDPNRPALLKKQELRYEQIASIITRLKHKDNVPLMTLIDSSEAWRTGMNTDMWDSLCARRVLMSQRWMEEDFFPAMHKRYPGAPYDTMPWASFACLDNFTIKVNYKAIKREGVSGYRLDMTNWLSGAIPDSILPDTNLGELYRGKIVSVFITDVL